LLPDRTYDHHHERLVYQHHQSLILPATSAATRADERSGLELMPPADVRFPDDPVRLIAFYLPQFHPIPENDAWWGDGFTEWTNVRKATPIFPGHLQPRVPTELGYYDLRDAEVRSAQAELARQHGLHGFCYYHYWFGGKRLLERPFEEVLATSEPDFPFAICWANEPWSRRWDGSKHDVLQPQLYGPDDDLAHIHALLPALADPRAIKVAGKALLLIYQGWSLPDAGRLTDLWRSEVIKAGLPGLHLVTVETGWDAGWDATQVGFDAKIRFQPQFTVLDTVHRLNVSDCEGLKVYPYADAWPVLHHLPAAPYPTYETVFPGWDNSPRRGSRGVVVHGGTPAEYGEWLRREIDRARSLPPGQRIVFINAWNEWAEGAYLEPDTAFGRGFLEATRTAAQAGVTRPGILGPLR
jgi:lipopolysaccharide biosynthesis protein